MLSEKRDGARLKRQGNQASEDKGDGMHDLTLSHPGLASGAGDEAALVAAARNDPEAFRQLYWLYVKRVYRYVYSLVGDSQEAEDLTSQVFTAVWQGLDRYKEQGHFAAWLFRIARNKTNDYYHRQQPVLSLDEAQWQLRDDRDPLADLEHKEALQNLKDILQTLSKEHIEMLRLRFAADLTYAEIGRVLGRSEVAIKVAMHRLLKRLQGEWERRHE